MQASEKKSASSKFPLRLMPSVRKGIESYSRREGVSLNQFTNVTLAEKLARLEHDEWLARRPQPSAEKIALALEVLNRPTQNAPAPGDELPVGYSPVRDTFEYPRTAQIK